MELTLRDYLAAHALALMSNPIDYPDAEKVAKFSYEVADAMLREREKPVQPL